MQMRTMHVKLFEWTFRGGDGAIPSHYVSTLGTTARHERARYLKDGATLN
jgi:hypothetical protein